MLTVDNLSKSFGSQKILIDASLQINRGERVGLLGRNGYGKSTLIKIILGQDTADLGEVTIPDYYRMAAIDQNIKCTQETVLQEACMGLEVHRKHEDWAAAKLLAGLGFSNEDLSRNPNDFSGGFQMRIQLAKVLLSEPDLLLLDEPTNYLDIVSIRWLEKFLNGWKGELLLVSHDKDFMTAVCTHVAAIHRQRIRKIKGSPEKWYEHIAQEEVIYERARVNEVKKRTQQEKFIREFRSGARSAGLVQSRIKMLAKQGQNERLTRIPQIKFHFKHKNTHSPLLLDVQELSIGYEKSKPLIQDFDLEIKPGEKIGIIGKNGTGKSTLLSTLYDKRHKLSGYIKPAPATDFAIFGQSHNTDLPPHKTVLQCIQEFAETTEPDARRLAANMLFRGPNVEKRTDILSGGEKARVRLAQIMSLSYHMVFLDEPTNHLDYESCEALIKSVQDYEGTMLFISHNEAFLKQCAERLIVLDGGNSYVFEGGYEQFLTQVGFQDEAKPVEENKEEKPKTETQKEKLNSKERRRIVQPIKRKLDRVEKEIKIKEDLQVANKEAFDLASRQGNRIKMDTLGIEYQEIHASLEELLTQWDVLAEELSQWGE